MSGAATAIDVFWHPAVLDHDTGSGVFEGGRSALLDVPELHPENAERVRNMVSVLRRGPIAGRLRWHDGRAVTARAYLVSLGIPADRLRTVSYGKEFPFDPGHDDAAWARNRRAHFVVTAK